MYVINNAKTGIREFDTGLENYLQYLANLRVLPAGRYALCGGAIRSLFDNTVVKDLDIYILGSKDEHELILSQFPRNAFLRLENPFIEFNVVNLTTAFAFECNAFVLPKQCDLSLMAGGAGPEVQIMSLKYDANFFDKKPVDVNAASRFANLCASNIDEILSSFDLTICKAGVEFNVFDDTIAVSEVKLPASFLTHVALRKMAFSGPTLLNVPQQLCSVKRFYKYLKYGYQPDNAFFAGWHERVKNNPHILSMSYEG